MGASHSELRTSGLGLDLEFGGYDAVVFNGDGSRLAGISKIAPIIDLWHMDGSNLDPTQLTLPVADRSPCLSIDFNRLLNNRSRLACGHANGTISIWTSVMGLDFGQLETIIRPAIGRVTSVAFSYDGELLVCGGENGDIEMWNTNPFRRRYSTFRGSRPGQDIEVTSIAFNPQGTRFASASRDVNLWGVENGRLSNVYIAPLHRPRSIAFNHDGSLLACACNIIGAVLWDMNIRNYGGRDAGSNARYILINTDTEYCTSVAFNHDGSRLACGLDNGSIDIWNPITRVLETNIRLRSDIAGRIDISGVRSVAFSNDGTKIAIASGFNVHVLETRGWQGIFSSEGPSPEFRNKTIINDLLHNGRFPSEWPQGVPSFGSMYKTYWRLKDKERVTIDAKIEGDEEDKSGDLKEFIIWICEQMAKEDGIMCRLCNLPMSIDGECGTKQMCISCKQTDKDGKFVGYKHVFCVDCKNKLQRQVCPFCKGELNEECKLPNMEELSEIKKELFEKPAAESGGVGGVVRPRESELPEPDSKRPKGMEQMLNTWIR